MTVLEKRERREEYIPRDSISVKFQSVKTNLRWRLEKWFALGGGYGPREARNSPGWGSTRIFIRMVMTRVYALKSLAEPLAICEIYCNYLSPQLKTNLKKKKSCIAQQVFTKIFPVLSGFFLPLLSFLVLTYFFYHFSQYCIIILIQGSLPLKGQRPFVPCMCIPSI